MNTNNLKKVAPRARTAFIAAIKARAAEFGITAKGHAEYQLSGEVLQVAGFTHPASIAPALKRLQQRLEHEGFEQLMEQMAYTWFNRFCAIRFMELKSDEGYLEHGVRLLSHPSQPQHRADFKVITMSISLCIATTAHIGRAFTKGQQGLQHGYPSPWEGASICSAASATRVSDRSSIDSPGERHSSRSAAIGTSNKRTARLTPSGRL